MAGLKPSVSKVDVDMVPLIDVIQLLLMFLVIVGTTAETAVAVPMKLPRASEAKTERDLHLKTEGRMVIQLSDLEKNSSGAMVRTGKYHATVNNGKYDLAQNGVGTTLADYLDKQVQYALAKGLATQDASKAVSSPVKLRIPEDCPMVEVEKVLTSLSKVGLVNVQYAAETTLANK